LTTKQTELITVHNIEHPRSVTRRIRACLTLAGAAAAGVLALQQPVRQPAPILRR
jgi:hypothetical protein